MIGDVVVKAAARKATLTSRVWSVIFLPPEIAPVTWSTGSGQKWFRLHNEF
jgi:hypothetical protein